MQKQFVMGAILLLLIAISVGAFLLLGNAPSDDPQAQGDPISLDAPQEKASQQAPSSANAPSNDGDARSSKRSARNSTRKNDTASTTKPSAEAKAVVAGAGALRGQVIWQGQPRAGVPVSLLAEEQGAVIAQSISDESGRFEIDGIKPDREYIACVLDAPWGIAWERIRSQAREELQPFEELGPEESAAALPQISIEREALLTLRVLEAGPLLTPIAEARPSLEDADSLEAHLFALANGVSSNRALVTDESGTLNLRGLNAEKRALSVTAPGYFASDWDQDTTPALVADLKPDTSLTLTFRLKQAAVVFGKVVAESTGQPIAGAVVEIGHMIGDVFDAGLTNPDGTFRMENVPIHREEFLIPKITLRIAAPGFAMSRTELDGLTAGEERDLGTIKLADGIQIIGKVLNEAREGIAGAEVFIDEQGNFFQRGINGIYGTKLPERFISTKTSADGSFVLDHVAQFGEGARPLQVYARAKGFGLSSAQAVAALGEEPEPIEIILKPAGIIRGVVVDTRGNLVAGAMVAAVDQSNGGVAMWLGNTLGKDLTAQGGTFAGEITTDQAGAFEIADLPESSFTLIAYKDSFRRTSVADVRAIPGQVTEIEIVVKSGGVIYGTYFGEDGAPQSGVEVSAVSFAGGRPKFGSDTSDELGQFRIEELDPGTYIVRTGGMIAMMSNFRINTDDSVNLAAGAEIKHDVYAVAPGTVTITGTVTLDGKPYTNRFTLGGGGFDGTSTQMVNCNEQGEFKANNVYPGQYTIFLGGMGPGGGGGFRVMLREEIRVERSPREQRFELNFETATVSGVVLMKNGAPLPDDVIVLAISTDVSAENDDRYQPSARDQVFQQFTEQANVNKDGTFRISGLSPGRYRFSARSKDAGYATTGEYNVEKELNGVRLELDGGSGTILGEVLNYVKPSDEASDIASTFEAFGILRVFDQSGTELSFGRLAGRGGQPDNGVQIEVDEESGAASFKIEGVPAGTWDITFQISNYVPVKLAGVTVYADIENPMTFALARSGDLEIEILNSDMDPTAAADLQYSIIASNGQQYVKEFTFVDLMVNLLSPKAKNSFILKDFPPDRYTMELKVPGYLPEKVEFRIASEQITPVKVNFKRDPSAPDPADE